MTWHDQLAARMIADAGGYTAFARKHRLNPATARSWVNGRCIPLGPRRERLLKILPGLELPPPSRRAARKYRRSVTTARINARIRKLSAEQDEYYEETGIVRRYSRREIAGDVCSRQAMHEMEMKALLSFVTALAKASPGMCREGGDATGEQLAFLETQGKDKEAVKASKIVAELRKLGGAA